MFAHRPRFAFAISRSPFDLVRPVRRARRPLGYVFRVACFPRQPPRPICFRLAFFLWRAGYTLCAETNNFRILGLRVFYQDCVTLGLMLGCPFRFVISGEPFAPIIYRHELLANVGRDL